MRDAPHGGPRIVVRRSGLHGKGVFARRAIRCGETIIEYKGERVDEAEIARRYPENRNGLNHTFVFGLSEDLNIDGGVQGNSALHQSRLRTQLRHLLAQAARLCACGA